MAGTCPLPETIAVGENETADPTLQQNTAESAPNCVQNQIRESVRQNEVQSLDSDFEFPSASPGEREARCARRLNRFIRVDRPVRALIRRGRAVEDARNARRDVI